MPRKPRGFGGRAPKDKMCNIPYSFYPEICLFVSYIKEVVVHFTVNQDMMIPCRFANEVLQPMTVLVMLIRNRLRVLSFQIREQARDVSVCMLF